jgi:hypothetical protein
VSGVPTSPQAPADNPESADPADPATGSFASAARFVTRMMTVGQRPAPPTDRCPYLVAQRDDGPLAVCDEVLAARLADGLRRLAWLGGPVERLLRRLAGRPAGCSQSANGCTHGDPLGS